MFNLIESADPAEIRAVAESARRFSIEHLAVSPGVEPKFQREDFTKMAALGLTGAGIPERFGGDDLSPLGVAGIIFELSRLQLGPAIYLSVHLMVARLLARWDTAGVHAELVAALVRGDLLAAFALTESGAGSDAAAIKTTAAETADGFILEGEKIYITSAGFADRYLVFARTGGDSTRGISAFIVNGDAPGISFGPAEKKMGCSGSPIATVRLSGCAVPKSALLGELGAGYKIALSGLAGGRINIAAAACGLADAALTAAAQFAASRRQFDQPIAEFQGLRFMFADMAMKLKAAILLTRDSTAADPASTALAASMAKCFATDSAMAITTDSVQIFGGAGYLGDYPVERLMRDAKMLQIVEGTNQIQRVVIAREIFKIA